MSRIRKILITGANGMIGRDLAGFLRDRYQIRLTDIEPPETDLDFVQADLANLDEMERACEGMDAVIHLGAASWEYDYESVMVPSNLIGVRQVFEAAHRCGVQRVLLASTFHTIGLHHKDGRRALTEETELRPDTVYAATKIYGEALGRWYAETQNLPVICLRIGFYQNTERIRAGITPSKAGLLLSPRDFAQMVQLSLDADPITFEIFHVTSNPLAPWISIEKAKQQLGYQPLDTVETLFGPNAEASLPAENWSWLGKK